MSTRLTLLCLGLVLSSGIGIARAQSPDLQGALMPKLNSQFVLTKFTADGSDVVRAGSIVTLHKDGLVMCSTQAAVPIGNTYKEGKLSAGKFAWGINMGLVQPSLPTSNVPTRTFVAGEKFWVTAFAVQKNEVLFRVFSDVYGDTRYYTQIAFPFNKKALPSADEAMRIVGEVLTAEPPPAPAPSTAVVRETPQQPPQPEPQMANFAPPPPPPDAAPPPPATVSLGQTADQVIAVMGKPKSISRPVAGKQVYTYDSLKVIFVNGKVSDVQ